MIFFKKRKKYFFKIENNKDIFFLQFLFSKNDIIESIESRNEKIKDNVKKEKIKLFLKGLIQDVSVEKEMIVVRSIIIDNELTNNRFHFFRFSIHQTFWLQKEEDFTIFQKKILQKLQKQGIEKRILAVYLDIDSIIFFSYCNQEIKKLHEYFFKLKNTGIVDLKKLFSQIQKRLDQLSTEYVHKISFGTIISKNLLMAYLKFENFFFSPTNLFGEQGLKDVFATGNNDLFLNLAERENEIAKKDLLVGILKDQLCNIEEYFIFEHKIKKIYLSLEYYQQHKESLKRIDWTNKSIYIFEKKSSFNELICRFSGFIGLLI